MRRRAVIALSLGGLLGGGAIASFGPVVRANVAERAEAYGAEVTVGSVRVGWNGVRLGNVDATIRDIPGLRVHAAEIVVGWDRRPRELTGVRVVAQGPLERLGRHARDWRAGLASPTPAPTPASSRGSMLDLLTDLHIEWSEVDGSDHRVTATGVAVRRRGGLELAAQTVNAQWGDLSAQGEGASVRLVPVDGGSYRLQAVAAQKLDVDLRLGLTSLAKLRRPAPLPEGVIDAKTRHPAPTQKKVHPRVLRARRLHQILRRTALDLERRIDRDLKLALHGVTIRLAVGRDTLALGPGSVRWSRTDGNLTVGLAPPRASSHDDHQGLSLVAHIPVDPHGDVAPSDRPLVAEVKGGPISLALLGIREGDLHLIDVPRATFEADARFSLAGNGETITIDGRGRLDDLSLRSAAMAPEPLEDLDVAWRGKLIAHVDGSRLKAPSLELNLGQGRLILHGQIERPDPEGLIVDLDFEVPLVACQDAFDAIPKAMVPRLHGMRFAGSIAAQGHARFDTRALAKNFDVDWSGTLGCRATDIPPIIDAARFKKRFNKTVYDAQGHEQTMEFGPETPGWTPLASISRYMVAAVLTTEDGRFFRHRGFDQEAIVNSIKDNLLAGRFRRGASTISMQLAKNLYLKRTKTIARKLQEAILTLYLEQALTKNEMMELYLNVIEYGPMVYGIGPATQHYFRTHPSRIALSQALYLSSILPNPKKQFFGAGGAVLPSRMRYLHRLMEIVHKIGRISEDELEHGQRETVVFGSPSPMVAPPEDPYDLDLSPTPPGDGLHTPTSPPPD